MAVDARTEEFQHIEVFDKFALFTNARIDRTTVPESWYCYDFRGTGDDPGELRFIEESVVVNHSGSILMPEKLERQIAFMQEKHSRLVFSSYIICDENNEEKGIFIAPDKITFYGILRDNKIGCLTAIYDSQAIGEKFYMPTLRKRQDWALFINILKRCRVAHGVKEPLAYYRIRSHSVSRNKFALIKYNTKVYRETLGFSKLKSWLYFLFLFMPSHTMKVIKRKIDSKRYLRQKNNF